MIRTKLPYFSCKGIFKVPSEEIRKIILFCWKLIRKEITVATFKSRDVIKIMVALTCLVFKSGIS